MIESKMSRSHSLTFLSYTFSGIYSDVPLFFRVCFFLCIRMLNHNNTVYHNNFKADYKTNAWFIFC